MCVSIGCPQMHLYLLSGLGWLQRVSINSLSSVGFRFADPLWMVLQYVRVNLLFSDVFKFSELPWMVAGCEC